MTDAERIRELEKQVEGLAAERDELKEQVTHWKVDKLSDFCKEHGNKRKPAFYCAGCGKPMVWPSNKPRLSYAELQSQVRSLTEERKTLLGVLEEMRDCDEGMGSHCIDLLCETLAQTEVGAIKTHKQAVESFRERAVRAIRARLAEFEAQTASLTDSLAKACYQGRDSCIAELASLVESLPLEPEQEEKAIQGK